MEANKISKPKKFRSAQLDFISANQTKNCALLRNGSDENREKDIRKHRIAQEPHSNNSKLQISDSKLMFNISAKAQFGFIWGARSPSDVGFRALAKTSSRAVWLISIRWGALGGSARGRAEQQPRRLCSPIFETEPSRMFHDLFHCDIALFCKAMSFNFIVFSAVPD
jgi:hypothetical protein